MGGYVPLPVTRMAFNAQVGEGRLRVLKRWVCTSN